VKLLGLGSAQYFASGWNIFDFSLVTSWLAVEGVKLALGGGLNASLLLLLRLIRIARLLRIVQFSPGIQRMIGILALSAPALFNVGLLLCLITYIYAIVGMQLFSHVAFGEFINDEANFASFGMAVLTLFRCITGESYNGLMHDAMVSEARSAPGRCSEAEGSCGSLFAIPYFVSFQILGVQVVLQLILAAMLDTFAMETQSDGATSLTTRQLQAFSDCWAELDPEATHMIPHSELASLVLNLPQPLGFAGDATREDAVNVAQHLKVKVYRKLGEHGGGVIQFHNVISAVTRALQLRRGKPVVPLEVTRVKRNRAATAAAVKAVHECHDPPGPTSLPPPEVRPRVSFQGNTSSKGSTTDLV